MRRFAPVAAAGLLALACQQGRAPESVVRFPGRVVNQDGIPLPGVTVTVSLQVTVSPSLALCQVLGASEFGFRLPDITTDQAGRYVVSVFQFQREQECLMIEIQDPLTGAGARMSLGPTDHPRQLPDLVVWSDRVMSSDGTDRSFEVPMPLWSLGLEGPDLRWPEWSITGDDEGVVWSSPFDEFWFPTSESPSSRRISVSELMIQDFVAEPVLHGRVNIQLSVPGEISVGPGSGVTQHRANIAYTAWTSGRHIKVPGVLPVSRGAACSIRGIEQVPCTLTDGLLQPLAVHEPDSLESGTPHVEFFRIDLGEVRSPRFVVLHRGETWLHEIETSQDAVTWTLRSGANGCPDPYCVLALHEPVQEARYVRALIQRGTGHEAPGEFSVFE